MLVLVSRWDRRLARSRRLTLALASLAASASAAIARCKFSGSLASLLQTRRGYRCVATIMMGQYFFGWQHLQWQHVHLFDSLAQVNLWWAAIWRSWVRLAFSICFALVLQFVIKIIFWVTFDNTIQYDICLDYFNCFQMLMALISNCCINWIEYWHKNCNSPNKCTASINNTFLNGGRVSLKTNVGLLDKAERMNKAS